MMKRLPKNTIKKVTPSVRFFGITSLDASENLLSASLGVTVILCFVHFQANFSHN